MINSKQIKRLYFRDKPTTWWTKLRDKQPIHWFYIGWLRLVEKIQVLRERVARCWAYARFGWDNYDFDAAFALRLLHFKLERLYRCLTDETGHTVQDKGTIQSLRLTIRLLKRLCDDNYSYFYERHNKKWNPEGAEFGFEPMPDKDLHRLKTFRDSLTDEQQQQEADELRAAFEADDATQARDARWAFGILQKYYPYWWD